MAPTTTPTRRVDNATVGSPPRPPTPRQIRIARCRGREPFEGYRQRYRQYVDKSAEAVEQGWTTWDEVNDAASAARCHVWVRVVDVIPARTRTPVKRPSGSSRPRARRRTRQTRTRAGPDDPDEPGEQPWALSFVDRAPVLWRIRGLRCRLLELREGVSR